MHRPLSGVVDPFSFSTIHFLRTCNRLMAPTEFRPYYNFVKDDNNYGYTPTPTVPTTTVTTNTSGSTKSFQELKKSEISCPELGTVFPVRCPKELSTALPSLATARPCSPPVGFECLSDYPTAGQARLGELSYSSFLNRRQRGEKKPIPDEQKDEKYYERRKRNNEAAKKSRDARKIREDRIAFRAAILEQENTILRAQVVALREEMATLRQIMGTRPAQISVNL